MRVFLTGLIGGSMLFAATAMAADVSDTDIAGAEATGFKVFDINADGKISAAEIAASATQVFTALDADSTGTASAEEFQTFNLGFAPLAETAGRGEQYKAAREAIFARWDMNGDKQLAQSEMVASMLLEGMAAANAGMDQVTFGSSQFMSEMKAALK
jgi:EF hand